MLCLGLSVMSSFLVLVFVAIKIKLHNKINKIYENNLLKPNN